MGSEGSAPIVVVDVVFFTTDVEALGDAADCGTVKETGMFTVLVFGPSISLPEKLTRQGIWICTTVLMAGTAEVGVGHTSVTSCAFPRGPKLKTAGAGTVRWLSKAVW